MTVTPLLLAGWFVLLLIQNASFTAVSRARNSGSDWYHAIASIFSNGIWWVSQTIIILSLMEIVKTASLGTWTTMTIVYVTATVTGAVLMGKILRRFVEKGKRQVGHYAEKEDRLVQLEDQVRLLARLLEGVIQPDGESVLREAIAALSDTVSPEQADEGAKAFGRPFPDTEVEV